MGILGLCLIRLIEYMLNSTFSVLSASPGLSFDNFLSVGLNLSYIAIGQNRKQ